jgi:hypothetical protein
MQLWWQRLVDEEGYAHCEDYKFAQPRKIQFFKTPEQDELIQRYVNVYGNDTVGLSRILAKVYVGGLLREPRTTPVSQEEEKAMRFGQTKLPVLTPFVRSKISTRTMQ